MPPAEAPIPTTYGRVSQSVADEAFLFAAIVFGGERYYSGARNANETPGGRRRFFRRDRGAAPPRRGQECSTVSSTAENQVRWADAVLKRLHRYLPPYAISLTEGAHVPDSGAGALVASSAGLDHMFRHVQLPTANPASILLIELDAEDRKRVV